MVKDFSSALMVFSTLRTVTPSSSAITELLAPVATAARTRIACGLISALVVVGEWRLPRISGSTIVVPASTT